METEDTPIWRQFTLKCGQKMALKEVKNSTSDNCGLMDATVTCLVTDHSRKWVEALQRLGSLPWFFFIADNSRMLLTTNAKHTKTAKNAFEWSTATPASASSSSTTGNINRNKKTLSLKMSSLHAGENFSNATSSSQKIHSINWRSLTRATISSMAISTTEIRTTAFQLQAFRLNTSAVEVTTNLSTGLEWTSTSAAQMDFPDEL